MKKHKDWQSLLLTAIGILGVNMSAYATPAFAQESDQVQDVDAALSALDDKIVEIRAEIFNFSPDALKMAEEAQASAEGLPRSDRQVELLVKTIRLQAVALDNAHRYDEAFERLAYANTLPLSPTSVEQGSLLYTSGKISYSIGDFGDALVKYRAAYDAYVLADDARSQSIALGQIAAMYLVANQNKRALDYIQRSLDVYASEVQITTTRYLNRALALSALGRYDEALLDYDKAMTLANDNNFYSHQQLILENMARFETSRGNYDAGLEFVNKAVLISNEHDVQTYLAGVLAARAEIERLTGRLEDARSTMKQIFSDRNINTFEVSDNDVHRTAYQIYETLGDHGLAFAHLKEFNRLDSQAKDLAANANNVILSAEFELSQKELEIEKLRTGQLERDTALATAQRRQVEIVAFGILVLVLCITGFVAWGYISARRAGREMQTLNYKLESKNNELVLSNADLEKANQAKVEFLATTSHEVRTPLNAIIGLTDVILNAKEFTSKDHDYLEIVNASGKNLLQILNDILDASKLEAGRMQVSLRPMSVSDCVLDVGALWRSAAEEKGLKYTLDVDEATGFYECDEKLLRQICSNLISNAIKFTHDGEVCITLKPGDDGGVLLQVKDTGVGIDPAHHEIVFETFRQVDNSSQRAFGGAGLGLAICKKIVDELGGKLTFESAPGEGSVFSAFLPIENCNLEGASKRVESQVFLEPVETYAKELSVLRVLVVEDNSANALVICAMLEGQVADIEVARNGKEAVRLVQERSFDVILMDKQMPIMDGFSATSTIRGLSRPICDIPIVGMTADIFAGAREQFLEAGIDAYIGKPVSSSNLKATLLRALKIRRVHAA